ncbi:MAG: hypothetical protein AAB420_00260 [Patescibacteria group bacterium]
MYKPLWLPHFGRQLKQLSKKYVHLQEVITKALHRFRKDQTVSLGDNLYKLRLASKKDIPRGKNKSFRLVLLVLETKSALVPVTIYFKGDRRDMSVRELNDHLEVILTELRSYEN